METSPLPVKGYKIYAYAQHSGPLSREGSLSCHTCCDTGSWFFQSNPKDHPIQSPLLKHNGVWMIYSNPNPHGYWFWRRFLKIFSVFLLFHYYGEGAIPFVLITLNPLASKDVCANLSLVKIG
jgi:hypothetical protein